MLEILIQFLVLTQHVLLPTESGIQPHSGIVKNIGKGIFTNTGVTRNSFSFEHGFTP